MLHYILLIIIIITGAYFLDFKADKHFIAKNVQSLHKTKKTPETSEDVCEVEQIVSWSILRIFH